MLMLPSPSRWTIVPPNASCWRSSALTYRSRFSSADVLVRLDQRRVADHVGEHHRDEPAIEPLTHRTTLLQQAMGTKRM